MDRFHRRAAQVITWIDKCRNARSADTAVHKIVARASEFADLELSVHLHMLRHGKGFQLASEGTGYACNSDLPRAQEHSAYRALHQARCDAVQRLRERFEVLKSK